MKNSCPKIYSTKSEKGGGGGQEDLHRNLKVWGSGEGQRRSSPAEVEIVVSLPNTGILGLDRRRVGLCSGSDSAQQSGSVERRRVLVSSGQFWSVLVSSGEELARCSAPPHLTEANC